MDRNLARLWRVLVLVFVLVQYLPVALHTPSVSAQTAPVDLPNEPAPTVPTPTPVVSESGEEEGTPSTASPALAPFPTPIQMLTPGMLVLTTQRLLPQPGEKFDLHVQVMPDAGGMVTGRYLRLSLPKGLQLLTGETEWALPDLGKDEEFERTVHVQLTQGNPDAVFKVEAALEAEGFAPRYTHLLLGVGRPGQGVKVLLEPALEADGVSVESRMLSADRQRGDEVVDDVSEVVLPDADEPSGDGQVESNLYLPLVGKSSRDERQTHAGFVRIWQIDALQQSRSLHELTEQATLVFDLLPLIAEGVDPTKLALYTRETEEDDWTLVPSDYYPEEALMVARVSHFSQWGLGDYLSASGELLPSVRSFDSDGYTGYATLSYAIETPSGLGGMSPGLSLSYSSGNADDLEIHNGDYAYEVQADWTGFGWNLGGVSYIARDFGSGSYRLVMNGLSADIKWNGNQWVTDPDQFLLINHYNGPLGYYREDVADWSIQTQDGTTYYFGGNQFNGDGEPVGNWTNILFRDLYVNNGWKSIRVGSKWYLRAVEDRLGNYMEYDYDVEGEGIGGECLIGVWWPDASRWYHKATYLREVRWSGNRNGLPARMRVQFGRENRPDWQVQYWDHRCVQARYAQQRLKTVLVQVHDSIDNQWYTLRQYQLNYSQSQLHSLLSSIDQYGKHGSQLLHTYSFGYQGGHNNVRLQTANNGQGGSTTYQYGLAWIHDCLNCGSIPWRTGIPLRRPVSRQYLYDGNGATTVDRQHAYADAKGQVTNGGFEYLGFSAHSQLLYTQSNVPELNRAEQRVETWYHQRTGNNIDPRRGRSYQQNMRAGVGDALIGYTLTTWQSTVQNGTNWVRKASEERHTHAADGNTQNKSIDRTYYFYESVYGNTVRVEERNATDSSQILRITTTDYVNPGGHMRKPSVVRVFRPDNLCVSEKRMSYNSYGLMINSQQPTSYCGDMNSANVISTNFTYDGYGNLVHEQVDGTNHHIVTHYEGFYALFPIRRYNASTPLLDERMQYYGVKGIPVIQGIAGDAVPDGLSSNDSKGFWGQVQQFCATDGFCTRQSYDSFGRPVNRWDRLTAGQAWPGDAAAATRWLYFRYQTASPNQNANMVVEWHAPRCQGNFVRKLYDGFGQLIQIQSPQHNWSVVVDGCGSANSNPQVVVDYAYDGLGRQVRASVPRGVNFFAWQHTPDWGQGHTQTWYDALGRTVRVDEPNQNTTWVSYVGRATSTVRDGNGDKAIGNGDRVLRWQQLDDLGRLQFVHNYKSNGSGGWTLEGEIRNSYKAGTDLLEKVENRNTTADAYTTLTTMSYDLAGRKTSMWDANLGNWSYVYDKLSNLTRQTDARNYSTCLGYDTLNRLSCVCQAKSDPGDRRKVSHLGCRNSVCAWN